MLPKGAITARPRLLARCEVADGGSTREPKGDLLCACTILAGMIGLETGSFGCLVLSACATTQPIFLKQTRTLAFQR